MQSRCIDIADQCRGQPIRILLPDFMECLLVKDRETRVEFIEISDEFSKSSAGKCAEAIQIEDFGLERPQYLLDDFSLRTTRIYGGRQSFPSSGHGEIDNGISRCTRDQAVWLCSRSSSRPVGCKVVLQNLDIFGHGLIQNQRRLSGRCASDTRKLCQTSLWTTRPSIGERSFWSLAALRWRLAIKTFAFLRILARQISFSAESTWLARHINNATDLPMPAQVTSWNFVRAVGATLGRSR